MLTETQVAYTQIIHHEHQVMYKYLLHIEMSAPNVSARPLLLQCISSVAVFHRQQHDVPLRASYMHEVSALCKEDCSKTSEHVCKPLA